MFGTNTLQNNTKQKLLPFKAQGVTHVYLMFDGDEAGQKAARSLKPLIEECEFIVEIIDWINFNDTIWINDTSSGECC